ncbi:MAG: hypothetical protein GY805_32085, partial [Chloroflexi bacterium]|nr:hypothetical protein [Chloroflexota bacterium]
MAKKAIKRKIRKGNDLFQEIQLPNSHEHWSVSNWDMWFLVALLNEFGGDWQEMTAYFHQDMSSISSRYNAEPKLSHLLHLQEMVQQTNLTPLAVLGNEADVLLKKEKRIAANKILKQDLHRNDKSYWMIHTPRRVREERSRRGYWDRFPVSPDVYAEPLTKKFKTRGYYEEDESFGLERRLSSYLSKQSWSASQPELIALYRAFLTVMLEKIEMVDDSYGVIGELYNDIFSNYICIPRVDVGLSSADFLQDILELLIWEDYGFTMDATPQFFANLSSDDALLAKTILQIQQSELAALQLVYQAERALTLLGLLTAQQKWFSEFAALAKKMGTRAWKRITRMAEKAE